MTCIRQICPASKVQLDWFSLCHKDTVC